MNVRDKRCICYPSLLLIFISLANFAAYRRLFTLSIHELPKPPFYWFLFNSLIVVFIVAHLFPVKPANPNNLGLKM